MSDICIASEAISIPVIYATPILQLIEFWWKFKYIIIFSFSKCIPPVTLFKWIINYVHKDQQSIV